MIPRARKLHERLERRRQRFVSILRSLTPEQRTFRPRPAAWSALEVGHHLVLVERRSVDAMVRLRGRPSRQRTLRSHIGYALLWLVLKTGLRVKNPVEAATPRADVSFEELEAAWSTAQRDLADFLEGVDEKGLRAAAYKHPVGGYFDVERALRFLVGHLEHHLRQLERLRKHPDYPTR